MISAQIRIEYVDIAGLQVVVRARGKASHPLEQLYGDFIQEGLRQATAAADKEAVKAAVGVEIPMPKNLLPACFNPRPPVWSEFMKDLLGKLQPAPLDAYYRDELGKAVRAIWIKWAREQPSPKESWLRPWDQLPEPEKEVDRRIGEQLSTVTAMACLSIAEKACEAFMLRIMERAQARANQAGGN